MKFDILSKKTFGMALLAALPYLSFAQKPNWQNLDLQRDSTFGISTERAYQELLKGKKAENCDCWYPG